MPLKNNSKVVLYTGLALLFIAFVFYIGIKYSPWIMSTIREPGKFKNLLLSYGRASILVFILFQVLQVVIASIPGELVQIAGGYVYGTVAGTFYSLIGIFIGYIFVFLIVRSVGYSLVKIFVPQGQIEKIRNYFQTKKADIIIFLLFLIPGIPKDFLVYIAGLTPVKPVNFFAIAIIARFPALLGSSFIGANIEQKDYRVVAVALAVSLAMFISGFFMRDKIVEAIEKLIPEKHESK